MSTDRLYSAFLHAYPAALRGRYGHDMLELVRALRAEPRHAGVIGAIRLWLFLLRDSISAIARERVAALPRRSVSVQTKVNDARPPYGDALLAALAVLALYTATLAPTVVFWDSGEYLTAAHVRGIPHPPGNPLFVLLAHGWERAFSFLGLPAALVLNFFSAIVSAFAHFFWFLVAFRIASLFSESIALRRLGASAAVALSATAFTVWNQSNVTEKPYSLSLLSVALVSWLILRWSETRSMRLLIGAAFVIALTSTNHLMGVLVAPAALLFVLLTNARVALQPRLLAALLVVLVIGLLPQFFLPYRSAQAPVLNENAPNCEGVLSAARTIYAFGKRKEDGQPLLGGCEKLTAMLAREQYGKPEIKFDPSVYPEQELPRGPFLMVRQAGNYLQYFNWQWARSIGGAEPLVGGWRPMVTLVFLLLGLVGARTHWRRDRRSAAFLTVLFLTLSVGLVAYMNFKYGYSIARERFPDPEMHEVRERDYFFLISFSIWAMWAGTGLIVAYQHARAWLHQRISSDSRPRVRAMLPRIPVLAGATFAIALVPLALNWRWASRADDYTARDWAYNVLMSVEPYGVLFTNGDNDTFPLWYLQEVEGLRRDVTVMVTGYLNTDWYARQVRDLTAPCKPNQSAASDPTRIICQREYQPQDLPAAIALQRVPRPTQSILPLDDRQIDQIAATPFVLRDPAQLTAGRIQTTIEAGTTMFPADTFVAAIVQATIGERPIHFTTPSPSVMKLGLFGYTVRQGLTFKLNNGPVQPSANLIQMPNDELRDVSGAFVDLAGTERRLNGVFTYRGRLLDEDAPFVDRAVANIMLQYAWAHLATAQAYGLKGDSAAMQKHVKQADWWQGLTE